MPLPVSLRDFIDEMDKFGEGCTGYLNRRTGEFYVVTDDEMSHAGDDEDEPDLADWERESKKKVREIIDSDDWLELPSKFEIDEYRIMSNFAGSLDDQMLREDLLDTIGGRGTFGRFKSMLARRNLLDDWHKFRQEAFKETAKVWLDQHEIAYCE